MMGAAGFVLLCACVIRMAYDDPKCLPMPQESKWKWGLAIILAVVLMIASVAKALWEYMP